MRSPFQGYEQMMPQSRQMERKDRSPGVVSLYLTTYVHAVKQSLQKFTGFNYSDSRSYRNLWKSPYHRHRIILVVCVIFLFLIYALLTSVVYPERRTQLSAYSSDWNDVDEFRKALEGEGYDVKSIQSSPTALKDYFNKENTYDKYEEDEDEGDSDIPQGYRKLAGIFFEWNYNDDLTNTALAIIGVERNYTGEEVSAIENYVWQGGNLLLVDDFGYGNVFADEFGMGFSKYRLYDKNYDKNTAFAKTTATTPYGSRTVLLNTPSTLGNVDRTTHIMNSNADSFIDKNGDKLEDTDEGGGGFPLCIMDGYGEGTIIMVSDPGIFINDMLHRYENRAFALDLVKMLLPSGGEVIFDESVHIPPGYFSNGIRGVLAPIYLLKTNVYYNIILIIVVVIVVEFSVFLVRDPVRLFRPRRMKNQASNVRYLKKNLARRDEIRKIFLEKIRVELGMNRKNFAQLSNDELVRLVNNREISYFLFDPNFALEPVHFGHYVWLMEQWFLMS